MVAREPVVNEDRMKQVKLQIKVLLPLGAHAQQVLLTLLAPNHPN